MGRVLPILFNGDMVRAILEGRKTVTRRVIKFPENIFTGKAMEADNIKVCENTLFSKEISFLDGKYYTFDLKPPYRMGDILYVRETWSEWTGGYIYRAWPYPFPQPGCYPTTVWRPSIHMPREAARIWLKVMGVRVERIQDMTRIDFMKEGICSCVKCTDRELCLGLSGGIVCSLQTDFARVWNLTIPHKDIGRYGWDANPWVWVIEFERCMKLSEEDGT